MNQKEHANRIISPELPTLTRYRNLFWQNHQFSITRALQYEILSHYTFAGKLLDVGGGDRASYKDILRCETYSSVNIDAVAEPTWVVGIGEALPCGDNDYDCVLSMNTFEHIFDVQYVLQEISRVLKPDGKFVSSVPFLFPIHGHPDDFFRPTASWWLNSLTQHGFVDINVTPLVWGPFSTGLVCSGTPGPGKAFRRHAALLLDILYATIQGYRHPSNIIGHTIERCALAFFVTATKQ